MRQTGLFLTRETGQGATLALLILITVLPVTYVDIRRMQRDR